MFSIRKLFAADSPKDRIFISYRRSDTEGYAGLGDTLKGYFRERSIEGAAALIVLIGPDWLVINNDGVPPNQVTMSPEKLRPRLRRIDSSYRGWSTARKCLLKRICPRNYAD